MNEGPFHIVSVSNITKFFSQLLASLIKSKFNRLYRFLSTCVLNIFEKTGCYWNILCVFIIGVVDLTKFFIWIFSRCLNVNDKCLFIVCWLKENIFLCWIWLWWGVEVFSISGNNNILVIVKNSYPRAFNNIIFISKNFYWNNYLLTRNSAVFSPR